MRVAALEDVDKIDALDDTQADAETLRVELAARGRSDRRGPGRTTLSCPERHRRQTAERDGGDELAVFRS